MPKLILIDGNSLMFRAYYATATTGNLMQNSKGVYTNCVYSLQMMIEKIMKRDFDHILVAFDHGKHTFRHEINPDYKGGRKPMPEELRSQISLVKEYFDILNIKRYEQELYEADDIIGTLSREAVQNGYTVDVFSSDKDMLQLVEDHITVHLLQKGVTEMTDYTDEALMMRYQLHNYQMIDLKALMGDPSDNLEGIKGIGEKTAIKLLNTYGSLEGIIENKDSIKGHTGDLIREHYEDALVCKRMVTINRTSPILVTLKDTEYHGYDVEELKKFYSTLEFFSLLKKMGSTPVVKKAEETPFSFSVLESEESLEKLNSLEEEVSMYLELDSENYHKASSYGMSISDEKKTYFIEEFLLSSSFFQTYFQTRKWNLYDAKKCYVYLYEHYKIEIAHPVYDMVLASYLINPLINQMDFKTLSSVYQEIDIQYDQEVYTKEMSLFDTGYQIHVAKKAYYLHALKKVLLEKLNEQEELELLTKMELPLSKVLASMEIEGLRIDLEELNRQKVSLKKRIESCQEKIYELIGEEFNIASTKKLGEILFVKLGLPNGRKTKTGYSTDSSVLEDLRDKHEVIPYIIEYRALTKLYSTYIEGLQNSIYPDQKVHTIFKQTFTQTGRLSSIEPNLQNIPIRTEEGHQIRKMFLPEDKDSILLSCDYSQIELRILAHMGNVPHFIENFQNGYDIHEATAKAVFHKDSVTKEERSRAKAVNFGIVYGISAFGLSEDLKISQKEAKAFIDAYMAEYPEIGTFMSQIVEFANENGYVKTIMNRRRYIPELKSSVYMQREFGKRTAMNAPIQGSSADILKMAMVKIYQMLHEKGLESKLINTVHDEVILSVKKEELNEVTELVKNAMESVVTLKVPLVVSCDTGNTWYDTK